MNKNIAVLGCGWLGLPLAISLIEDGYNVKGSTTREARLAILKNAGILPFLLELTETGAKGNLSTFLEDIDILIIDVPPRLRRNPNANFVAKIAHLLKEVKNTRIKQLIFISSTSVYGDLQGKITETTPIAPQTESGKQLVQTEELLLKATDFKTTIIRFAGLIGEDRHPANFLAGKKGLKNPNAYVNLIHLEDCIAIIKTIIKQAPEQHIFNAAYPFHPTKQEYYTEATLKKGLEPPEFVPSDFKGKLIASDLLTLVLNYQFKKHINL